LEGDWHKENFKQKLLKNSV